MYPLHLPQMTLELEREGQTINNKERLVRGQEFVSVRRRPCTCPEVPLLAPRPGTEAQPKAIPCSPTAPILLLLLCTTPTPPLH